MNAADVRNVNVENARVSSVHDASGNAALEFR